jgi:hypothetical protein
MMGCRLFGHRYQFTTEETTLRWRCMRGCGAGGTIVYATAGEAAKFAAAFERSGIANLGGYARGLAVVPLLLARLISPRPEGIGPHQRVTSLRDP